MNPEIASEPAAAVVVAAGSGSRLGAAVPKALVAVGGVTLLTRSLRLLAEAGVGSAIVVAAAEVEEAFAAELAGAPLPVRLVAGGPQRQHSVALGLAALEPATGCEQVVLIHDAARAFVPPAVVRRVIAAIAAGADAAIPVTQVADTIRATEPGGSHVVDRTVLRAVQTPQGFRRGVIAAAHAALQASGAIVTDDAAAAELAGYAVELVDGDRAAFKVTDPFDLLVAEALVRAGS